MTYEEAEAAVRFESGTSQVNPRWVACYAALGRKPQAWEFMIWNDRRWREFLKPRGFKEAREFIAEVGVENGQAAYDNWLIAMLPTHPEGWDKV